jgi:glycosyltransferase involved in cell wall biosynthesis
MRIGVNCFILQSDIGGIKQYFLNLFNELLANDHENEYVLFYFEHNIAELKNLQSDCWSTNGILLKYQEDIAAHWKDIDLYFCPFSTLAPRPVPLPSVYTIPDLQEFFYPQFFTSYNRVARAYHHRGSSKMADRIMTHSAFSKQTIVKYHEVKPEKILVAYHSVDERFFRAEEIGRRPKADLPENYLFFPANHWVHKNHDLLLRAAAWLKKEKQVQVNLVFTGFEKDDSYPLSTKVREYDLSDQVFQLGYVTVEEVAYLYANAQLLVFPSLFEGFGFPLVEAMAAGCPVLAARSTSLPEIGGDAASYFDPSSHKDLGRAINRLLNDEELRKQMVIKGKERAKDFTASSAARKHLDAFEEASRTFSKWRYRRLRFFNKYYYKLKIIFMMDFYRIFYEKILRKYNRIRVGKDALVK